MAVQDAQQGGPGQPHPHATGAGRLHPHRQALAAGGLSVRFADAVVRQVLADQGTPGQRARVTVTCDAPAGNCHVGTSVITVRVDSGVDLPFAPAILGREAASFSLDATHTVPIGQYVESGSDGGSEEGGGR